MKGKLPVYLGWTIVWALALYYIWTNALRYFNLSSEVYSPGFKPFAPFIMMHVSGGMIALLIGPLQFFPTIRNKYPRFHRRTGRIYLSAVVLAGFAGAYLAIFDNILRKQEFMFATGTMGMASAWLTAAGMAFWAVKKRNFSQHREWVIRSYVLTCNFIIFRIIFYALLGLNNFPFKDDVGGFTAWASWSVPLLITELVLQSGKIRHNIA